jgi:hypothetical protein
MTSNARSRRQSSTTSRGGRPSSRRVDDEIYYLWVHPVRSSTESSAVVNTLQIPEQCHWQELKDIVKRYSRTSRVHNSTVCPPEETTGYIQIVGREHAAGAWSMHSFLDLQILLLMNCSGQFCQRGWEKLRGNSEQILSVHKVFVLVKGPLLSQSDQQVDSQTLVNLPVVCRLTQGPDSIPVDNSMALDPRMVSRLVPDSTASSMKLTT